MADFLEDILPEDFEPDSSFDKIDELVNGWIKAHLPFSWQPTNRAIAVESLPWPMPGEGSCP